MKILKDLSAAAVADCIEKVDVPKLDIPEPLKADVVEAIDNDWTSKYHTEHLYCSPVEDTADLCDCWDDMRYGMEMHTNLNKNKFLG